MANKLKRRGDRVSRSDRWNRGARSTTNDTISRRRRLLLQVGDFAFLVCVGIAATAVAYMVHDLGWRFVPTCLVAMVAAMAVQTLMTILATPILGSIESAVPSMIVAMVSPMAMCAFHLTGQEPTRSIAMAVGSLVAVGMFVFLQRYARTCVKVLAKECADVPT